MVKVEVGGKNILEIPCVDIPERTITSRDGRTTANVRRSFTDHNGRRTSTRTASLNLNWHSVQPRLVITSDTDDFDEVLLQNFRDEGFQVWYTPYDGDKAAFQRQLAHLADPLELGETYAIVAYGDAAALVLESVMKPTPKLCAVVAYYPPYMPKTSANFPPSLNLAIHLASSQKFGTRHQKNYRYPDTQDGFAESDLEEFDKPAARVAWTRTLACLRRGFGVACDVEGAWTDHLHVRDGGGTGEMDVDELMKTMTKDCSVNHVPTLTGGAGQKQLKRFYSEFFGDTSSRPRDFKTTLLSRTVGTDRVVDEMLVSFTHNVAVEWMLPGVPPTGKGVEVAVVVVAAIRGGRICAENVYWDQAGVLVQLGLLDPKVIPEGFTTKAKENDDKEERKLERLPVVAVEGARKVVDEDEGGKLNRLIPGW